MKNAVAATAVGGLIGVKRGFEELRDEKRQWRTRTLEDKVICSTGSLIGTVWINAVGGMFCGMTFPISYPMAAHYIIEEIRKKDDTNDKTN
jgi:hypothetical protein